MNKFCLIQLTKEKERNLILMSFWRTSEKKTKLFMQFAKEKEMYVIIIILLENFLDAEAKHLKKLSKMSKIVKN